MTERAQDERDEKLLDTLSTICAELDPFRYGPPTTGGELELSLTPAQRQRGGRPRPFLRNDVARAIRAAFLHLAEPQEKK
jgi:hypothetical protein